MNPIEGSPITQLVQAESRLETLLWFLSSIGIPYPCPDRNCHLALILTTNNQSRHFTGPSPFPIGAGAVQLYQEMLACCGGKSLRYASILQHLGNCNRSLICYGSLRCQTHQAAPSTSWSPCQGLISMLNTAYELPHESPEIGRAHV